MNSSENTSNFQFDEFFLDLQDDGREIKLLNEQKIKECPFPGLRPFKTSEFQLFKGRDRQVDELLKKLESNHFLAVIGGSGTGKSSLVRAGIIPLLLSGYSETSNNKWKIAISRPGHDPVGNLAVSLSTLKWGNKDKENIEKEYGQIRQNLNNTVFGLLDFYESLDVKEPVNLLIIIDQFEELFRFKRKDQDNENIKIHFVNLLLKSALNTNSSIYVIITMRSEFLSDCVKFRGLAEAINNGQYLVPQLDREQLKEVITGPIRRAGKEIEPGLAEMLINETEESKLTDNLDQLSILQHALMCTYKHAGVKNKINEIKISDYNNKKVGGMKEALSIHASAKYNELANKDRPKEKQSRKQRIAQMIFQSLTDQGEDGKGGRRPTELKKIYEIVAALDQNEQGKIKNKIIPDTKGQSKPGNPQITKVEVDEVINHFRGDETSFIMPPNNTPLNDKLIIDISHESLMRNWETLNKWIKEEAESGKYYKRLNERREELDKGNDYITGGVLEDTLDWLKKTPVNAAWASRYHNTDKIKNLQNKEEIKTENEKIFNENIKFLKKSQKIEKNKRRWKYGIAVSIPVLIIMVWGLFSERTYRENLKQYINHYDNAGEFLSAYSNLNQMKNAFGFRFIPSLIHGNEIDSLDNKIYFQFEGNNVLYSDSTLYELDGKQRIRKFVFDSASNLTSDSYIRIDYDPNDIFQTIRFAEGGDFLWLFTNPEYQSNKFKFILYKETGDTTGSIEGFTQIHSDFVTYPTGIMTYNNDSGTINNYFVYCNDSSIIGYNVKKRKNGFSIPLSDFISVNLSNSSLNIFTHFYNKNFITVIIQQKDGPGEKFLIYDTKQNPVKLVDSLSSRNKYIEMIKDELPDDYNSSVLYVDSIMSIEKDISSQKGINIRIIKKNEMPKELSVPKGWEVDRVITKNHKHFIQFKDITRGEVRTLLVEKAFDENFNLRLYETKKIN